MLRWRAAIMCCTSPRPLGGGTSRRSECTHRSRARRNAARSARGGESRRQARGDDVGCGHRPPAAEPDRVSDETVWADPDDPQFDAYRRVQNSRGARRVGFHEERGRTDRAHHDSARCGVRPDPDKRESGLGPDHPGLAAGPPSRHSAPRILGGGRARPRRSAHPRHDSPEAAGQRFIAAGEFMWMEDIAETLRLRLGNRAAGTPTRRLPNFIVRLLLPFMPHLKGLAPMLGRKFPLTSEKSRRVLGFSPRPATTTINDCAESLVCGTEPQAG